MAEIDRCKRTDGKRWRCRLPVVEGKSYCKNHINRQKKKQKIEPPKSETEEHLTTRSSKRMKKEIGPSVVKDLKLGRMEIEQPAKIVKNTTASPAIKIRVSPTNSVPRRPIRSKNVEPNLNASVKMLPSIKDNVKAAAKKTTKKCHQCQLSSYDPFVKCLTCKKQLFCQECIDKRFNSKVAIMRKCPVCQGECSCPACTKGKHKEEKKTEVVVDDVEEENEVVVYNNNGEKKFEKSQQLHLIRELIPVMEKINQEKMIEFNMEAKRKGVSHDKLQIPVAKYPQKKECSFCKDCIPDAHRSCDHCSYILCLNCCQEFCDGYLHEKLNNTKTVRTKKSIKIPWRYYADGTIKCPPKTLGGCGVGLLILTSFSPFNFTKDLEANGKEILSNYKFKKPVGMCSICDENDETGSQKVGNFIRNKNKCRYITINQESSEKNLEHFMNHWGRSQPIVIFRDVLQSQSQSQPGPNWDFGYMLCEYLKKSAENRNATESRTKKSVSDWCEVEFNRKQIFRDGVTHLNVWNESLKYKLRFNLGFLQDNFPNNYNSVMKSLPVQEYMNPYTGFLNLAAFSPYQSQNPNLGSHVEIQYGGIQDSINPDFLKKLCCHAYDMINVLAHASHRSVPERKLNEIKKLMNKYNSEKHMSSSKIVRNRNKIEEMFANEVIVESDDSSTEEYSDSDSECSQNVDSRGAFWDIFKREDVPKLLEYFKKYSDLLISRSYGSPKNVVHPLFDEMFYLDDNEKERLKKEFDVEGYSFEQNVGEGVMIPAGCPYQIRKTKSCVNVVLEFISPESASECIKVCDEIRLLPVNHIAKGKMLQVKEMVINRFQATVEEIRKVSPA